MLRGLPVLCLVLPSAGPAQRAELFYGDRAETVVMAVGKLASIGYEAAAVRVDDEASLGYNPIAAYKQILGLMKSVEQ